IKHLIDSALESANISNKSGFIQLLESLFPKLGSIYGNRFFGNDFHEIWSQGQRVCSESYFNRYFTYSIPHNDISDEAIVELVQSCKDRGDSLETGNNPILNFITTSNAETAIRKLRQRANTYPFAESVWLSIALCLACEKFPNPETLYNWTVPFSQSAILVSQLIQNLNTENRVQLACDCIHIAPIIDFKLEIFKWLPTKDEERPEKDAFSEEKIEKIGKFLGKEIVTYLESRIDITVENPNSTSHALYIIQKYVGQEELDKYIQSIFENDQTAILRLLDTYTGTSWGVETGVSHKSDFRREQYNNLIGTINPQTVLDAIEKYRGVLPTIEEHYPEGNDSESREVILKQFVWLHSFVQNEKKKESENQTKLNSPPKESKIADAEEYIPPEGETK
ncbi:MAG: NTPase, partial [SAR324 cluster bacterium]